MNADGRRWNADLGCECRNERTQRDGFRRDGAIAAGLRRQPDAGCARKIRGPAFCGKSRQEERPCVLAALAQSATSIAQSGRIVLAGNSRFRTLIRGAVRVQSRFPIADSGAGNADPRISGYAARHPRCRLRRSSSSWSWLMEPGRAFAGAEGSGQRAMGNGQTEECRGKYGWRDYQ